MSWLARSIANSLRLDDDEDEDNAKSGNGGDLKSPPKPESVQFDSQSSSSASTPTARGVKEDFSELTKTISRQLWGVASFLAPPPESSHPHTQISDPNTNQSDTADQLSDQLDSNASDEAVIAGIRSDFAEIGGKFKSGISKLSSNKAVFEITKIASNFLQFGSEGERSLEEFDGVVGVTEDVVTFARNLAMHPETWLDFPLPDDDDTDDFELSDAQQEHALAVESLSPRLAALRMELCPGYMSDGSFWKIYFVLLHPRLNKQNAELLSTPQIAEARAMLTHELDKRIKEKQAADSSAGGSIHSKEEEQCLSVPSSVPLESVPVLQASAVEAAPSVVVSDIEMEKHPVQSTEVQIVDKSVVAEAPVNPIVQKSSSGSTNRFSYEKDEDEDDTDDWLKEDTSEIVGASRTSVPTANDDDVSFSDLEDDDGDAAASYKKVTSGSDSSTKDSRDWVQLSRDSPNSDKDLNPVETIHGDSEQANSRNPERKDSNDWLNVDDDDVM